MQAHKKAEVSDWAGSLALSWRYLALFFAIFFVI